MGTILISVPDISDDELVFDENETRRILKFFWPHLAHSIDDLAIDNEARRLAQTMLMAAIEGSHAIGYIQALGETIVRPGSGMKPLARKLAIRFARHWWSHTQRRDLENVRIYDSVRGTIAQHLRRRIDLLQVGAASRQRIAPFYALTGSSPFVWS